MHNKNLLFLAACLAMLLFGIACVAIGTINEYLTATFSVDKIFIGFLASLFAAGALIGSVSFGPIVDRFGYKVIMIVSLSFLLSAFEIIARTNQLIIIRAMIFLLGLGGGIINGAASALVADLFTEKKGAYLSFLGVFWGVGALSLPLVTSILLKINMSYSAILSIIGSLAIIPMVLFIVLKCPEAKNSGGIPYRKYLKMMKNQTILLIGFFLFFQSGFETLTTTWTPKYFMEVYSSSTQNALISLTVMSISLTISRLILGIALKKTEAWKVLVAGLLMTFSGLILMKFGASYIVGLVGIGLLGFGAAASFPVMLGYVGSMFPDISGAAFSLVLVMALTGNMLLNALGGIVFETYQVASFSLYMMAIILIMFVILYFIILKLKKQNILNN
ncbi:MAG TPA: MFS transporter [Prolixibacteraceae bacterium]|nr:MFS transporter [Prolixibacteraceae bacterium]